MATLLGKSRLFVSLVICNFGFESGTLVLIASVPGHCSYNTCTYYTITKTSPCTEDLLTPHFYIEKLGFTGVFIIFLFLLLNIDCGYTLEPPHSNVYPQYMS